MISLNSLYTFGPAWETAFDHPIAKLDGERDELPGYWRIPWANREHLDKVRRLP
jgi:hypothetical protein